MLLKLFLIFIFVSITSFPQEKTMRAVKTDQSMTIDGRLDEPAWIKAHVISDFVQQEPKPGAPPSQKTEVRILYDENNIYLGVVCYDLEPEKIIARELKWDGRMSADDNFQLIFDTFNDNMNGYWFATNPLGMHDDALMTGSSWANFNESWNGLWDVQSAITDSGWSIEFIFPLYNFKFDARDPQVWGVNFSREVRRTGEVILWSGSGLNRGFFQIPFAGELHFESSLKRGNPVFLKPFVTAGYQDESDNTKEITKAGLDIKYPVTRNLTLDVSFNSDFAQVEADKAEINLTRFPLFFPEKRDFFLEGANVFNFALGGSNNLFYSRRIGLKSGREIPIINGLKLVGRVENTDLGILNVVTSSSGNEPLTNYSVIRTKQDFLENSYYGFLVTNKLSASGFNSVFAGDMEIAMKDFLGDYNLTIGTGLAKSNEKNDSPDSWAGKLYLDFPNDLINIFSSYRFIQKDFNPEMGFISRGGVQVLSNNLRITPRLNKYGIRKLEFIPMESSLEMNDRNELISGTFAVQPFGFDTPRGDEFAFEVERKFDEVDNDFTFFKDKVIKKGRHWFTNYSAAYQVGKGADLIGGAAVTWGDFYEYPVAGYLGNIYYNPTSLFTLELQVENLYFGGEDKFSTLEFSSAARFDFSTKFFTFFQVQWKNETNDVGVIYRINYQPKIGSNIYFVVNQMLDTTGKIRTSNITLLGKIVWLFNL